MTSVSMMKAMNGLHRRDRRLRLPALLLVLVCSDPGRAQSGSRTFRGGMPFPLSAPATAIVVEDFDGDGGADIAVCHESTGEVTVIPVGRDGVPGTPGVYAVGAAPIFISVGDLDGSDTPDLFVTNSGSSSVSVLLNHGDGTFVAGGEVETGLGPRASALADLDGDGNLDAVVGNFLSFDANVLLGDGRGGFRETDRLNVGDNFHSVAIDDIDGDGRQDVAALWFAERVGQSGVLSLFPGRGDGTFQPAVDNFFLSRDEGIPRVMVAADFGRDGDRDLVVLTELGNLFLLRHEQEGRFGVEAIGSVEGTRTTGQFSRVLRVVDFDGDGFLDVTAQVAVRDEPGIRVLLGSGEGIFTRTSEILFDTWLADLAFGDLNRDGVLDVAAVRAGSPEGVVVRGLTAGQLDVRTTVNLEESPRDVAVLGAGVDLAPRIVAIGSRSLHISRHRSGRQVGAVVTLELSGVALQRVAVADFDGDGTEELALTDLLGGRVIVAGVTSDGTLGRRVEHEAGLLPSVMATGDLDGDGVVDLAVGDQSAPAVLALLRPGAAGIAGDETRRTEIPVGAGQTAIDIADLDGDGVLDLAVATRQGVRLVYGNGRGGFHRDRGIGEFASSPALKTADLDSDGQTDLAVVSRDRVVILYAVAASDNPRRESVAFPSEVRPLELRDVDRDGRVDLLTASTRAVWVVRGVEGGFGPPDNYPVGVSPRALVVADVDADGRTDCVAANLRSRDLSILHGAVGGSVMLFRRGDSDLDGHVDLSDAVAILNALFAAGPPLSCPDAADTNDDGRIHLADVVGLLNYLFAVGMAPEAPGPETCGVDPSADELTDCQARCR